VLSTRTDCSAAVRVAFRGIGGLIVAVLAAWILKATVVSVGQVASLSMSPTLDPQEYVLISRSSYRIQTPETFPLTSTPFPSISIDGWSDVQREDLIALLAPHAFVRGVHPSQAQTYVKRCIAVPGDTVHLAKEALWVRGTHDDSAATARYSVRNPRVQGRTWVVPGTGDTLRLGRSPSSSSTESPGATGIACPSQRMDSAKMPCALMGTSRIFTSRNRTIFL